LCTPQRYLRSMTVEPRAALDRLIAAFEAHFHAVTTRRADDDPAVDDAYDVLADAFEVYEDALVRVHGEALPFSLLDGDEDEEDEDEDDLDDADEDDDADDLDEDDLSDDDLDDDLEDLIEDDDADEQ
jgi:hypothetical protein